MKLVKIKTAGFTLVELLVVMAILGVLVTLVASGFRTAQLRGRDAQRKSDLREIANALELIQSDYNRYPASVAGQIGACPFDFSAGVGTACAWGTGRMTDGSTVYFQKLPEDPDSGSNYFYRLPGGASAQKFQLFARLENSEDKDCLGGDCENPPVPYSCGSGLCNFAITSTNTDALE